MASPSPQRWGALRTFLFDYSEMIAWGQVEGWIKTIDNIHKKHYYLYQVMKRLDVRNNEMGTTAVKITRKGQVTIPKEIREKLNSTAIYFEVANDIVTIKPVRDAAGSLSEYAGKVKPGLSMKRMKEKAWEEAVREKSGKKSS